MNGVFGVRRTCVSIGESECQGSMGAQPISAPSSRCFRYLTCALALLMAGCSLLPLPNQGNSTDLLACNTQQVARDPSWGRRAGGGYEHHIDAGDGTAKTVLSKGTLWWNDRRVAALTAWQQRGHRDDILFSQGLVDGRWPVEFKLKNAKPPRFRSWVEPGSKDRVVALVTRDECTAFEVIGACKNDRFSTEVLTKQVECTDADSIVVDWGRDRVKLPAGTAVLLPATAQPRVSASVSQGGTTIWKGALGDGDVDGASLREVTATLDGGEPDFAEKLYDALPTHSEADANAIVNLRVAKAKAVAGISDRRAAFTAAIGVGLPPSSLPGDEAVAPILAPALAALASGEPADADDALTRLRLLGLARGWSLEYFERYQPEFDRLHDWLGKRLVDGTISDQKVIAAMRRLFPRSTYIATYDAKVQRQKDDAALARQVGDRWTDVAEAIDRISILTAKKQIAEQVGTSSQTRRAIPRMGAEIVRETRDEYCTSKQAFIDLAGPAEFQQRARSKCTDEPPTASGVRGAELILTNECRALVANNCAATPAKDSPFMQRNMKR